MTPSCPTGKHPHATSARAFAALRSLMRRKRGGREDDRMHVWKCEQCQLWHIGHAIGTGRGMAVREREEARSQAETREGLPWA